MTGQKPTIVLVNGAFADSSSWDGVIARLQARSVEVVAVANPLRSLSGDAGPVATGGTEFAIGQELYPQQFCADVPPAQAAVMAATQRPATEAALTGGLPTDTPGWKLARRRWLS